MSVKMISHQQIEELVAYIDGHMVDNRIHLEWMAEGEDFSIKDFTMDGLKGTHNMLCMNHVHAPTVNEDGSTTGQCPYCDYGGSLNEPGGLFTP